MASHFLFSAAACTLSIKALYKAGEDAACLGIAALAPGETDLAPALVRADAALYAAKVAGRDRAAA